MIPSAEHVMRTRSLARTILRAACLVLLVLGLILVLWEAFDDLIEGDLFRLLPHYPSRNSQQVSWLILSAAIVIALWFLQNLLVRWLVPWPTAQCPQCGYHLQRLTSPRCPECGCDLPPSMVRADSAEPPAGS